MTSPHETPSEAYVVADHPALDLLNTVARVDGGEVDFLQGDADVIRWLKRIGWPAEALPSGFAPGALAAAVRKLREIVRPLIVSRKNGKRADPAALNVYLREAGSHPELAWDGPGAPRLERKRGKATPVQFLAPLAESAAALLSEGDFALVRPCANPDCVLWFYDRTKSHRRRWCSMAACGNRHKVAAFRQRHAA